MTRLWTLILLAPFGLAIDACRAQAAVPHSLPVLDYPPIARAARVQGDVVVSFRKTPEGSTSDVKPISGPLMLQGVAIENVKAWHFAAAETSGQADRVTFHFQLDPPNDGYDSQPVTKVELDGTGSVRVLSISTTGLEHSACPPTVDRVPPSAVTTGDFVEVSRWNETVRVSADGSIVWKQRSLSQRGHINSDQARSLLERFRTPDAWGLCGHYYRAGLMDGGSSSLKMRIGGREKSVSDYGDIAPPIFEELELAVDAASNSHQWRHGDPKAESIVDISYEYLPKPGKTKLMDAAHSHDMAGIQAATAKGDKLTDGDASGWTPLMYAAGSWDGSVVGELLKAGADVNVRSLRGETALMASAVTGMADEDLLNAGADVNASNDVGMTALMLLVQRGEPDEIAILLKAGADAHRKDGAGRTALDYLNAANCGRPIVRDKDPRWYEVEYSKCNGLHSDDYVKSKQLLMKAGAKATRAAIPKRLLTPAKK